MRRFKDGFIKLRESAAAKWGTAGLVASELSAQLAATDWFRSLNEFSSEVSKSMDADFLAQGISKAMTPSNHRVLDGGHDLFSSLDRAREVGTQQGWTDLETFTEWAKAYLTDLSSPAGMPVLGKLSDEIYLFLQKMGVDEAQARDFVTINGQEAMDAVLGASLTAVAIAFSWKSEDKARFSQCVGSILCTSTITMSPIALAIAMIALAIGYNRLVCKEAIARGAIVSGAGLLVSALIPGPVLLGFLPALVVSIVIARKMGTEFKPIEQTGKILELTRSPEFRQACEAIFRTEAPEIKTR